MLRTTNKISKREFEVLNLISLGYKIHEIAKHLFISPHTVISHRKNLFYKLDASNSGNLIRKAFEYRILIPTPMVELVA